MEKKKKGNMLVKLLIAVVSVVAVAYMIDMKNKEDI